MPRRIHVSALDDAFDELEARACRRAADDAVQAAPGALFAHFPALQQDALLRTMPRDAVAQPIEEMTADDRSDLVDRLSEAAQ